MHIGAHVIHIYIKCPSHTDMVFTLKLGTLVKARVQER